MPLISETDVEDAVCAEFSALGWSVLPASALDRPQHRDVLLTDRLDAALARLNPGVPSEALALARRELTGDFLSMERVKANQKFYELLRDGVKVTVKGDDGVERPFTVRVIDWDDPAQGDFLLVRQLPVSGVATTYRPDLVGFVNGIPLVVGELKGVGVPLETALEKNLDPYRVEIPQLFVPNALVLLSNHGDTRIGSFTGTRLEHFARWTRLNEGGARSADLSTALRAVFTPRVFLDIVENFILYEQSKTGQRKLVGQNHQVHGVNRAFARIEAYGAALASGDEVAIREARRLGVYWHTQGSGKSYSMALLVRKVHRKLEGDWSFVVVTDREDLDDQIHDNFKATGAATGKGLQARSAKDLTRLLKANERVVFTLIHKFRVEEGKQSMAVASASPRVVVLADEAHRSQYSDLATNMRAALPSAGFMAFTGTPLLAADVTTREKFGDYVSRYPFFAAIEDGATVPIFYEATLPDLQLGARDLDAVMDQVAKDAGLSEDDRKNLEAHFSRQYILLTRSSRLDKIAEHLVDHFLGFGPPMKAMAVCIDRATTLRLAHRVDAVVARRRVELAARVDALAEGTKERRLNEERLKELDALAWAAVLSRSQGDVVALARALRYHAKGVVSYAKQMETSQRAMREGVSDVFRGDRALEEAVAEAAREGAAPEEGDDSPEMKARQAWIRTMIDHDPEVLARRFKDKDDPLRLIFVCSMWITGFDAPPCGIVYLDRPMANHTLMQTIARANRVFPGKDYGRVLDYIGVLKDLEAAFKDYEREYREDGPLDRPVADIAEKLRELDAAVKRAKGHCQEHGISLDDLRVADRTQRLKVLSEAVDQFALDPEARAAFRREVSRVDRLYVSLGKHEHLPQRDAYREDREALKRLDAALRRAMDEPGDLSAVLSKLDAVLDAVLDADVDEPIARVDPLDIATIDLAALAALAKDPRRGVKTAAAGTVLVNTARTMAAQNPTLLGLQKRIEDALAAYVSGAQDQAALLAELVAAAGALQAQAARAESEGLTREELPMFDVLRESLGARGEDGAVREGVKSAVRAMRAMRFAKDWRLSDQKQAAVRVALRDAIEEGVGEALDDAAREALRARAFAWLYERG